MVDSIVFIAQQKKKEEIFPRRSCAWKILNKLLFVACRSRIVRVVSADWLIAFCLSPCVIPVFRSFIYLRFFFLLVCEFVPCSCTLPRSPSTRACVWWLSAIRNFVEINGNKFAKRFQFVTPAWIRYGTEFSRKTKKPILHDRKRKKNKGFRSDFGWNADGRIYFWIWWNKEIVCSLEMTPVTTK